MTTAAIINERTLQKVLNDVNEIKKFIKTDISREIRLAKISNGFGAYLLDFLHLERGGGNMMTIIALLKYTEFAGNIWAYLHNIKIHDPFTSGFGLFQYKGLPKSPSEIKNIILSSLVEPIVSTEPVSIEMLNDGFEKKYNTNASIALCDKQLHVCVEKYFNDLMTVLNNLEVVITGHLNANLFMIDQMAIKRNNEGYWNFTTSRQGTFF
jgi:hypothetical protein